MDEGHGSVEHPDTLRHIAMSEPLTTTSSKRDEYNDLRFRYDEFTTNDNMHMI